MSDTTAEDIELSAAPPAKKKFSGKKLVLFIVLPLLLGGGGVAAAWKLHLLDGLIGGEHAEPSKPKQTVFYDLPEILVNLSTTGKQASYLKLRVALELDDPEAIKRVEQLMPRVIDNFQVYLRELRMDELNGSAGLYRLKEELLLRVNHSLEPVHVSDVLFKEMLVQ